MQFSVTTTEKNGILQACERYMRFADAGITGNTARLAQFTNFINRHNRKVWHMIFSAYGGWQYDDANQTDLPAATATITADQTSYALPTGSLTVRGVEVKNTGGVWSGLLPITEEQIRERQAMGEFYKTSSQPLFYQLVGQTVRIYPASNYTQSSSFKVFFDRGSVAFLTTDTTKEAGFASEYHDILPIGASIDALTIEQPDSSTLALLRAEYADYEKKIKDFYQTKFSQMFPPRIRVRDVVRESQ